MNNNINNNNYNNNSNIFIVMDRNLKVEHNMLNIPEGEDIILTLQDTNVLNDDEDILENIHL